MKYVIIPIFMFDNEASADARVISFPEESKFYSVWL